MECDICLEKFDHSLNKPLVLIRCAHTLCARCVENLVEKKCPNCNAEIEEARTNWSVLKTRVTLTLLRNCFLSFCKKFLTLCLLHNF